MNTMRQLLLIIFLLACPFAAVAQDARLDSLESTTVTGTRVAMSLNKSARIVTILDSISIASAPADNVNDILKYTPGVDVRQRGAMGMQTDISVRGGTFDQIAVLLNGVSVTL